MKPWSAYKLLIRVKATSRVLALQLRMRLRVVNLMLTLMDARKAIFFTYRMSAAGVTLYYRLMIQMGKFSILILTPGVLIETDFPLIAFRSEPKYFWLLPGRDG